MQRFQSLSSIRVNRDRLDVSRVFETFKKCKRKILPFCWTPLWYNCTLNIVVQYLVRTINSTFTHFLKVGSNEPATGLARFTNSLHQGKPLLALKNYCQDLLKACSEKFAWTLLGYFCDWPYCICICKSFPFWCKVYGRRVFKWITQHDLLSIAVVNLLVFVALFTTHKKWSVNRYAPVLLVEYTHRIIISSARLCCSWCIVMVIMEMRWLHLCSLFCALSVSHLQNFPLP